MFRSLYLCTPLTFDLHDIPNIPPYTVSFISSPMPGFGGETDASPTDPTELPRREIGGLYLSEMWWRDHYRDLEAHGYRLRYRYHPDWEPSWKRSGKDFFDAEDGQPTIVSVIHLVRPTLTTLSSYELRWMLYA